MLLPLGWRKDLNLTYWFDEHGHEFKSHVHLPGQHLCPQIVKIRCSHMLDTSHIPPLQVAPAPSERQLILPPRAADGVVREWLHTQLYVLAVRVGEFL